MRITRFFALGLLLTVVAAGCGQAPDGDQVATVGGTASANAGGGADPAGDGDVEDAALRFSQCMRDQGLSWFPDPEPVGDGGGVRLSVPKGADKTKVDAAMEACKKFAPGGDRKKADPEMLEQARKMAQCMRENGVPKFPDPEPDGSIRIDGRVGIGPGDPAFDKADEACSKFRPDGAGRASDPREGE